MATKKPTGVPTARQEQLRRERALNTARANIAERATAQAQSKTVKSAVKKYGAKALGGLGIALQAADTIQEFRSAKTKADYARSTANLMQTMHPIGWIGGPIVEELQTTRTYQNAQTRALDWADSVNPAKRLRDAKARGAAKLGAEAARKRRDATKNKVK